MMESIVEERQEEEKSVDRQKVWKINKIQFKLSLLNFIFSVLSPSSAGFLC